MYDQRLSIHWYISRHGSLPRQPTDSTSTSQKLAGSEGWQDSWQGIKVEALSPEKRAEEFLVSLTRERKEHMILNNVYIFKKERQDVLISIILVTLECEYIFTSTS